MKITVFTPTYNRAYSLSRLYESLKKQTFKDFEWLVVDDGSTDNTTDIIQRMINDSPFFKIQYIKTENGGKHRAINRGIELARGELFFLVDSDDWLPDDSLEYINQIEDGIPIEQKNNFAGIYGLKCHLNNEIIGRTFQGEKLDINFLQRNKYGISGDKAEVYYTRVLKQYHFPEIEEEKFLTERIVWDKIAYDGYLIRFFNHNVYYCEYLEDGLTHGGYVLYAKNPKQWALAIHQDYQFGLMNWYHTSIQIYIYYLYKKRTLDVKTMAKYLQCQPIVVRGAVALQKNIDIARWILHRKVTIKSNVEAELLKIGK